MTTTPCDFCGGPRLNGMPVERDPETGGWRQNIGPNNPAREDFGFACRECAKRLLAV